MRLLSIDFDGVLHPQAETLDDAKLFCWLPLLAEILEPFLDVRLAVHSTWRYNYSEKELRGLLGQLGGRVLGSVPRGPREDSILWFVHLAGVGNNFRVLDDDTAAFKSLAPEHLISCDPMQGISASGVQQTLSRWLRQPGR